MPAMVNRALAWCVYAIIFTVVNLCVDLAYGWLDPRIRYE